MFDLRAAPAATNEKAHHRRAQKAHRCRLRYGCEREVIEIEIRRRATAVVRGDSELNPTWIGGDIRLVRVVVEAEVMRNSVVPAIRVLIHVRVIERPTKSVDGRKAGALRVQPDLVKLRVARGW